MRPFLAERLVMSGVAIVMSALMISSCATSARVGRGISAEHAVLKRNLAVATLKRAHFDFGSDQLNVEAKEQLGANINWLQRHADSVLVLEGHCDEVGDIAYNMQLGDRRARRVKGYLIAQGVDQDRLIMVVSHGELRPLDPGHTRDAHRQNRRVEFIVR